MPVLAVLAALPLVAFAFVVGLRAPVRVLLAAYAFVLPVGSGITLSIGVPAPFNTVSSLFGLAVLCGMLAHLMLGRRSARQILPAVPAWLIFAALAGFSIAWSVNPSQTAKTFLVLVSLIAFYVVAMLMPVEPRDVSRFEEAVVAGGALAGLYGIVLLGTSGLQLTRRDVPRFATAGGVGEGTDPNITAATLILPLALALSRALRAKTTGARAAFGVASALIGIGIVLTGSRGGLIAALVSVIVVGLTSGQRRKALAIALTVVIAGGITMASAPETLRTRIFKSWSSGRTDIWRTGLAACDRYCWAGSGWGTFPTVYQDTLHTDPGAKGLDRPFVAHNIYISAAIEIGIVGLALMLFAVALVAWDLVRLPKDIRGPPFGALAGLLVASMFLTTVTFKYFWLVMIYAGLTTLAHAKREQVSRPEWVRSLKPINA
jgi:O-antigen ligase